MQSYSHEFYAAFDKSLSGGKFTSATHPDHLPTAVALAAKAALEVELVGLVSGHVTTKGDLARITKQAVLEAE